MQLSYAYDGPVNRLTKTDNGQVTTYAYNAANALTLLTPPSGVPTTSTYDANGNLTLENSGGALTTYTWDSGNRLTGLSAPGDLATYPYRADGQRDDSQPVPVWGSAGILPGQPQFPVRAGAAPADGPGALE